MEYLRPNIHLKFSQDVIYELQGERRVVTVNQKAAEDVHVQVISKAWEEGENGLRLVICVKNIGGEPLVLREINYIKVEEKNDFAIRGKTYEQCLIYRQGRHKNDIPSIFCLASHDESMQDAADGMTETGDVMAAGSRKRYIHSDSMTMFHADGMNVLWGFMSARNALVDCSISTDPNIHPVIQCGCRTNGLLLEPGAIFRGEELYIVSGERESDLISLYAKEKADRYRARKTPYAPAVFCTWYYYGLTVTFEDVCESIRQIQNKRLPFNVFQVDEGWEITLGEWKPNHKFPRMMKDVADRILAAGMRPGIWTSPFIAHETATVFKEHPEWVLKQKDGKPCLFHMNDTVYLVFDITNPDTYPYFKELYRKLTNEWGFTYHKLDFTRAAVIYEDADFTDKTITLVAAYYRAVKAIREGMGEDSYFLMCGGLYDPVIGLVDGQRMGADVLSMWESNVNRDGKALPFTVKQNLLRYYMNWWWNNDPDALMVRRQKTMSRNLRLTYGLLNDEEVKTAVANQYIGGGLACSTEPLDTIDDDRLYQLRHVMPVMNRKVEVRNLFNGPRFPDTVDVQLPDFNWNNLVLINWSDDQNKKAEFRLSDDTITGLEKDRKYLVSEFYSGDYVVNAEYGDTISMGTIRPHGCCVFKIQEYDPARAYIVKSTAHYSMGGEVEKLEITGGTLVFDMNHKFDVRDQYSILLPAGYQSEDGDPLVTICVEGTGRKEVIRSVINA